MSGLQFKQIHKFFRVTISFITHTKKTNSDKISLNVYNKSSYKTTLPLGLFGYCETKAIFTPTEETAYRKKLLKIIRYMSINNPQ